MLTRSPVLPLSSTTHAHSWRTSTQVLLRSLNLLTLIDEIVPQEPLDNLGTLRQSAAVFLAEVKHGRALLALLEAIMFKCTKTRPPEDQLVTEFCEARRIWNRSRTSQLPLHEHRLSLPLGPPTLAGL